MIYQKLSERFDLMVNAIDLRKESDLVHNTENEIIK
jgi:hypothetical protein